MFTPCSAANFCTLVALLGPQITGRWTSPVSTPSASTTNRLHTTWSMPRYRATGSACMVSADELSTTVWPRR
jgi:hypothetical protein